MQTNNVTEKLGLNQWLPNDDLNTAQLTEDNRLLDEKVALLSALGVTSWDSGNFPVEEGIWTPRLRGSTTAGNITYTYTQGWYYTLGLFNYIIFRLNAQNVDTAAGTLQIVDLPFAGKLTYGGANFSFVSGLKATIRQLLGMTSGGLPGLLLQGVREVDGSTEAILPSSTNGSLVVMGSCIIIK